MSYIGEIRMFAGNFAPVGWAFCDGALYPISENDALFTLIGTRYGGDGESTFAVPNLQSRVPRHPPAMTSLGGSGGVEAVTLTALQMPSHSHAVNGSEAAADSASPAGNLPAEATKRFYLTPGTPSPVSDRAIGQTGGTQPHDNMQPYTVISFIISMYGIYPSAT